MEAKATVMPLEYSALDGLHCAGISDQTILRALEAQAEISFRAGYEKGIVTANALNNENLAQMYQAGIKEVVEFVNKLLPYHGLDEHITVGWDEKWQAQKRKWGLDV